MGPRFQLLPRFLAGVAAWMIEPFSETEDVII